MNQDFYNSNLFGFDQFQFPQFPINYPPQETNKEILQAREDLMEVIQAFLKEYDHIPPNEKCMALLLAEERFLEIKQAMEKEHNQLGVIQELLFKLMDDLQIFKGSQQEKKETAAQIITPDLPIKELDNSLIMGDEYLDTLPSVEELVPIPSESEGISDGMCDVPLCDNPTPLKTFKDPSEIVVNSNDDNTSSDNDDFKDIEYVEASPPDLEIVSLEEVNDVD
ncbi:hypothetical protein Tco_0640037, partial [Tanacetum coccineum]